MADSNGGINTDSRLVRIRGNLGGADNYDQITCVEVSATESLLTPGLQTSATFQSQVFRNKVLKNWDVTKGQTMYLNLYDDYGTDMSIAQTIYRLDNRAMKTNMSQVEEMTFHACDASLLQDAQHLVSKSWKCTSPDEIVRYVLSSCVGAQSIEIEPSPGPSRDYIAEMIHPFQVVQQQANVALDDNDPSYVHYMTYGTPGTWQPTHHFKSLKYLASQGSKATYEFSETAVRGGVGYNDKSSKFRAIHFSFPCDYDLLSDLLNGLDENGNNINSGSFLNVADATGIYMNGNMNGCIRNGNFKQSLTNKGTSQQQNGCDTDVEKHLLRRQARMGLLERDKIAFRMIAPWNPDLHAGDVITFNWHDKRSGSNSLLYGSGDYLIASMTHRIQLGGFATTTFDCVSSTVGRGIV